MSNLIERLLGIDSASKFNFVGTKKEVKEFNELVRMIKSVSTGRQLLKSVLVGQTPSKISFVSGFEDSKGTAGRFYRDDNSIEIVKIDTSLPDMSKRALLQSKVMMARVLIHELQHCADASKNNRLDALASNVDEAVVTSVLAEMKAYWREEQTNEELRARYHLLPKLYIYHHPDDPKGKYRVANGPTDPFYVQYGGQETTAMAKSITPKHRKAAMIKALCGDIPKIKKHYMDRTRRRVAQRKSFPQPTLDFRVGVENYLKDMEINMSFDDVMLNLSQSVKLLSCPNPKRSENKR